MVPLASGDLRGYGDRMTLLPFHLAIPVDELAAARAFYGETLGCAEGRSSAQWIDFDFFGHQLVTHLCVPFPAGGPARDACVPCPAGGPARDASLPFPAGGPARDASLPFPAGGLARGNAVDGHEVPVPHFGVVLTMADFDALAARLAAAGVTFIHDPMLRFAGQPGEQATMFLRDPAGNALEFKAFTDDAMLFAR